MKISIVAYVTPNSTIRLNPLLWHLGTQQFKHNFDLNIINFTDDNTEILSQLNNYKSSFKWKLFSIGGDNQLLEIINGNSLVILPGNCIPFKNAIEILMDKVNTFAEVKVAGPLFALSTNNYSTNTTQDMIEDCLPDKNSNIWHISKENWIKPIDEFILLHETKSTFISLLAEKVSIRPELKVTLVKNN